MLQRRVAVDVDALETPVLLILVLSTVTEVGQGVILGR